MFTALLFLVNFVYASNSQDSKKERYFVFLKIVFVVAVIAFVLIAGYFGYKKYKFSKKVEEIIKFLESNSPSEENIVNFKNLLKEALKMISLFSDEDFEVQNFDVKWFFGIDPSNGEPLLRLSNNDEQLKFNENLRKIFNVLYSTSKTKEMKEMIERDHFVVDLKEGKVKGYSSYQFVSGEVFTIIIKNILDLIVFFY